jgi:hypothetical protein
MIMSFAHRDELESFFTTAESASGLASSWTALVGIALGGAACTRDPEGRITDRRFALGPAGKTAVSHAREVRATLGLLSSMHQNALFALYGSVPWPRYLESVFGKPIGIKVVAKLGDLLGVALLTDAVAQGFARDRAPSVVSDGLNEWEQVWTGRDQEPLYRCRGPARTLRDAVPSPRLPWKARPRVYANEGGWLVDLCGSDREELAQVRREAEALRGAAENAYAAARGPVATSRARVPPARRARRPAWDPFARPRSAS